MWWKGEVFICYIDPCDSFHSIPLHTYKWIQFVRKWQSLCDKSMPSSVLWTTCHFQFLQWLNPVVVISHHGCFCEFNSIQCDHVYIMQVVATYHPTHSIVTHTITLTSRTETIHDASTLSLSLSLTHTLSLSHFAILFVVNFLSWEKRRICTQCTKQDSQKTSVNRWALIITNPHITMNICTNEHITVHMDMVPIIARAISEFELKLFHWYY